jgi:DNA polymerase III delta subunit
MIQRDKIDFDSAVKSQFLFFKIEVDFRRHLKNISLQYLIKLLIDLEKIEIRIMSGEKLPKLIILDYILANEMKF